MRASVAILLSIVLAFIMITALGVSAQDVESTAMSDSNESADAYNMTEQLHDGVGTALGPGLVFGGIAAFIVIALGFLVKAGGGR